MTIGAPAPDIDIDDWVHPGTAHPTPPFVGFEPGKIYVLEFWATWCKHSREAVPHLAELRKRHGADVVVIGLALDVPESLRGFLADADPDVCDLARQAGTFCLVVDPDGSVQSSYMDAIRESSIPTAFIIGRQGAIEWIGHPQDLAEPLDDIVTGSWDRAAFAAKWERLQAARMCVLDVMDRLATNPVTDAIGLLDGFAGGHANDPLVLNEVAWLLVERTEYGPLPAGILAAAERAAARGAMIAPTDGNVLDTLAHVQELQGRVNDAIATQRRAVALGGNEAARFREYLERLEARSDGH